MAESESFMKQHTKPRMLLAMGGLGFLGSLVGGPLCVVAGVYAGHLLGRAKKTNVDTPTEP